MLNESKGSDINQLRIAAGREYNLVAVRNKRSVGRRFQFGTSQTRLIRIA